MPVRLEPLLFTCAWWTGLWDLHTVKSWDIGPIGFYFSQFSVAAEVL